MLQSRQQGQKIRPGADQRLYVITTSATTNRGVAFVARGQGYGRGVTSFFVFRGGSGSLLRVDPPVLCGLENFFFFFADAAAAAAKIWR